jgi:hypothetical protein
MKVVNLLLAVMFLVFAFVQINDPDPVVWILIYGSMAVICILAAFHYYSRVALSILLLAFIAYAFLLLPGFNEWLRQEDKSLLFDDLAKMQHLYIEETRELLGLIICMVVILIQFLRSRGDGVRLFY